MSKFIVLDISNLAHRALHSVGDLTHPDNPDEYTGVMYQLWKTCEQLERTQGTHRFAFCFDSKDSIRQEAYPPYKQKRKAERTAKEANDPVAKRRRWGMIQQVLKLPKLLRSMGSLNVFGQQRYEADDMAASIAQHNPDHELVIVSSDSDLFQLLRPGVTILNPISHKQTTDESFRAEWGISPIQWSSVKAWAGCTSDNIDGLPGVGEKTAIKWMNCQIKEGNGKYALFTDALEVYTRNKPLVTLPYPGTITCKLTEQPNRLNWNLLAELIGSTNYIPEGLSGDN